MQSVTHELLTISAALRGLAERVDNLSLLDTNTPRSADLRAVLAFAALMFDTAGPRSIADTLRFGEAVQSGDGTWLLLRSVPGECRADAWHFAKLPADVRKALGV